MMMGKITVKLPFTFRTRIMYTMGDTINFCMLIMKYTTDYCYAVVHYFPVMIYNYMKASDVSEDIGFCYMIHAAYCLSHVI